MNTHLISNACVAPPFPGVGLAAGKAAAAEILESVADPVAEAEEAIEDAVEEAIEEGVDGPVSPATSDPLVLGGAAVAIGVAVGAAAAMSQNSEESTPAAAVTSTASTASRASGTSQASKVKEVRDAHPRLLNDVNALSAIVLSRQCYHGHHVSPDTWWKNSRTRHSSLPSIKRWPFSWLRT